MMAMPTRWALIGGLSVALLAPALAMNLGNQMHEAPVHLPAATAHHDRMTARIGSENDGLRLRHEDRQIPCDRSAAWQHYTDVTRPCPDHGAMWYDQDRDHHVTHELHRSVHHGHDGSGDDLNHDR
jgi:hypothetical protein